MVLPFEAILRGMSGYRSRRREGLYSSGLITYFFYSTSTSEEIFSTHSLKKVSLESVILIAFDGHMEAHRPQILQSSLILALPSTMVIASIKHTSIAHSPQPIQSSVTSIRAPGIFLTFALSSSFKSGRNFHKQQQGQQWHIVKSFSFGLTPNQTESILLRPIRCTKPASLVFFI